MTQHHNHCITQYQSNKYNYCIPQLQSILKMKAAKPSTLSASVEKDSKQNPSTCDTMLVEQVEVMRRQEDRTYFCTDYLKETICPQMIDELCRSKMLKWCFQVADCGLCKRETVVVASSYLDRFLSSGTPRAMDVIKTRKTYQLASITTLYMAIKLFEPFELDIAGLAIFCKKAFTVKDFVQMENDILSALNWRVHGPTANSFLEHFFALVPTEISIQNKPIWQRVIQISKQYIELTLDDFFFVTEKPSIVAVAIISNSLKHIPHNLLNAADRLNFFLRIANVSTIDIRSEEIILATKRLASIPNQISDDQSKYKDSTKSKSLSSKLGNSSPTTCVTREKSISYSP